MTAPRTTCSHVLVKDDCPAGGKEVVTITHNELIAVAAIVSAVIFYVRTGIYLHRWKKSIEITEEEQQAIKLRKEIALLSIALREAEKLLETQDKKRKFSSKRS